jgi:hypothetical protein
MPINWPLRFAVACTMAVSFCGAVPERADAQPVKLDFTKYGKTKNSVCPASPNGICAAAAAINSFTFLQNTHQNLYMNLITPNLQNDGTDAADSLEFANYYYNLGGTNSEWLDSFMTAKKWWINGKAPGSTIFNSMYAGSGYNNGEVTTAFLEKELRDGEDIEIFVKYTNPAGTISGHALTLFGIDTTAGAMKIWFQDPNDPTNPYDRDITLDGGVLSFSGLFGLGDQTKFSIYAAFAESAVPEATMWAMMIVGFGGIGLVLRSRRSAPAASRKENGRIRFSVSSG